MDKNITANHYSQQEREKFKQRVLRAMEEFSKMPREKLRTPAADAEVGAVLTTWHSLPHRARLVLVAIAHLSFDEARPNVPARRYFGGVGHLAEVLYGPDGVDGRDRECGREQGASDHRHGEGLQWLASARPAR